MLRLAVSAVGSLPLFSSLGRVLYDQIAAQCARELGAIAGTREIHRVGSPERCAPGLSDIDFTISLADGASGADTLLLLRRNYLSLKSRFLVPGECLVATSRGWQLATRLSPSLGAAVLPRERLWPDRKREPRLEISPSPGQASLGLQRLWRALRLRLAPAKSPAARVVSSRLARRQALRALELFGDSGPQVSGEPFGLALHRAGHAAERANSQTRQSKRLATKNGETAECSPDRLAQRVAMESWMGLLSRELGPSARLFMGRCPFVLVWEDDREATAHEVWRALQWAMENSPVALRRIPLLALPASADALLADGWRGWSMPPSWLFDPEPPLEASYLSARGRMAQRLVAATGALLFAGSRRLAIETAAALFEASRIARYVDDDELVAGAARLLRLAEPLRQDIPANAERLARSAAEALEEAWRWVELLVTRRPEE